MIPFAQLFEKAMAKEVRERPNFCSGVQEMAMGDDRQPYWRQRWVRNVPQAWQEEHAGHIRQAPGGWWEMVCLDGQWHPLDTCPGTPNPGDRQCLGCMNEQREQYARAKEYRMTNLQQHAPQSGGRRRAGSL